MTGVTVARNRLEQADDLAALLEAAHEVFVAVLTALRACEDPASVWFGRFVMAAASAADGRDAVIFAPSMPGHRAHATRAHRRRLISGHCRYRRGGHRQLVWLGRSAAGAGRQSGSRPR